MVVTVVVSMFLVKWSEHLLSTWKIWHQGPHQIHNLLTPKCSSQQAIQSGRSIVCPFWWRPFAESNSMLMGPKGNWRGTWLHSLVFKMLIYISGVFIQWMYCKSTVKVVDKILGAETRAQVYCFPDELHHATLQNQASTGSVWPTGLKCFSP